MIQLIQSIQPVVSSLHQIANGTYAQETSVVQEPKRRTYRRRNTLSDSSSTKKTARRRHEEVRVLMNLSVCLLLLLGL